MHMSATCDSNHKNLSTRRYVCYSSLFCSLSINPIHLIVPMSPHKLMGIYMEGLILGVNTMYMLFCFFKLFPIGRIELIVVLSLLSGSLPQYAVFPVVGWRKEDLSQMRAMAEGKRRGGQWRRRQDERQHDVASRPDSPKNVRWL